VDGGPALAVRSFTIDGLHPISVRSSQPGTVPVIAGPGLLSLRWMEAAMVNYAAKNQQVWDAGAVPAIQ